MGMVFYFFIVFRFLGHNNLSFYIMEVSKTDWESKLNNLHTREKGISSEHQINYKSLLSKVFIGETVLDVGCGTRWLKNYLPKNVSYIGLDACIAGKGIINMAIEDITRFDIQQYDTLFIFAALDGMRDLKKALENIRKMANKNIVILTGVNIPPDQYHTHLITENFIDEQMAGLKKTVRVQVHPKIVFLEYTK